MPIENRNLEPGTVLTARYKKQEHTCEVVQTDDGLRYRLDDGTMHKSPSSAGKAVIGHACNGWAWWSLASAEKPKREPKAKADKPTKAAKPAPKAKGEKHAKGAGKKKPKPTKAALKSNGSYGCGACGEMFPTVKAATEHALTHTSAD
jgi:hypothetical protein